MNCPETDRRSHRPLDRREDRFYAGGFSVLQPQGTGLRSGLDALLLAATVPPSATGYLADLGAGAGTVGLAACSRAEGLRATLVEKDPQMAALARQTLQLAANRKLSHRLDVVETDILRNRFERETSGLRDQSFDHVLTNPPYNPPGHRASPDGLRAAATIAENDEFLSRWFRVSAALLRHGGTFAAVLRADALPSVLPVAVRYLGGIRTLPVHPRPTAPAGRILILSKKGSRAPFAILPGIHLHDRHGEPTSLNIALSQGQGQLGVPERG